MNTINSFLGSEQQQQQQQNPKNVPSDYFITMLHQSKWNIKNSKTAGVMKDK